MLSVCVWARDHLLGHEELLQRPVPGEQQSSCQESRASLLSVRFSYHLPAPHWNFGFLLYKFCACSHSHWSVYTYNYPVVCLGGMRFCRLHKNIFSWKKSKEWFGFWVLYHNHMKNRKNTRVYKQLLWTHLLFPNLFLYNRF